MHQQPPADDPDMPDAGDPELRDRVRLADFYDGALELHEDRAIRARLAHDPRARRILAEVRAVREFEDRLRAAFHASPPPEQRHIIRSIGLDPALLEASDPQRSARIAASTTYVLDPHTAPEHH
ncbi:hypothetical protein [Actinomycetospora termitidis]|uniref:Uncharacterized protein n=1 Tax=Actinomycetospora termitidis TaxID=3053470 RepID=A0ABT7MIC3_9PSEU|nr:hypothetical protein [Actinomycetospora sp. Odt1-22]MDL5160429.1 hypothetical protein [Actinomycetospora sp. Odt1-22]